MKWKKCNFFFRKKEYDEHALKETELHRVLGLWDTTTLGKITHNWPTFVVVFSFHRNLLYNKRNLYTWWRWYDKNHSSAVKSLTISSNRKLCGSRNSSQLSFCWPGHIR